MRITLSLTLSSLLGLACTRVGEGTDEAIADASESASSESTADTTTMASSESSTSEPGSSETSSSGTGSTETSAGESSTDTSSETSTTASETSTTASETTTETGVEGVTVDLGVLALVDVNPNSASANQKLHPLDYEGQLSAWYFAHAT